MKPEVKEIIDFIRNHDNFLVSGHIRSDGDALGSQLAFYHALRKLNKKVDVVCDHGALPDFQFMPGTDKVGAHPKDLKPPYEAVITFDSGAWSRLERIAEALDRSATTVINVDHHASNDRFGNINWIEPDYSSSGEMALELIRALNVELDKDMATCIYVAIFTDTGKFSFSNTTATTHRNAADLLAAGVQPSVINDALHRQKTPEELRFLSLATNHIQFSEKADLGWITISQDLITKAGFEPGDTQEYIDLIRSVKGVRVALLFRELDGKIKFSFRTKEGVDGVELASKWGGGGHVRASGASVAGRTLQEVEQEVVRETLRFIGSAP